MNLSTAIVLAAVIAAAIAATAVIIRQRRCASSRSRNAAPASHCTGCAIRPFCSGSADKEE